MRTLRFIIDGQVIKQDPTCDFSGLVPGTEGLLRAEFIFSSEWKNYAKVAAFWSVMGKEYEPKKITSFNECLIPSEALKKRVFKVQVVGVGIDGEKIRTNKVEVKQKGGKV